MTDWQIIDSDDLAGPTPETPPPAWRRWGWELLATGLVLVLVLAGLWQQRREGRAALSEDLNAAIFAEETNRFLGRFEEALYQVETSDAWQRAYRHSFEPQIVEAGGRRSAGSGDIVAAALTSIDYFDGRCAVITLTNSSHDPVRAYCLAELGWLRTPIPPAAWGEVNELEPLPGLRLQFRDRDREFAEGLAADLAGLADRLSLAGLEIILEPHDLSGPLILAEANRIVLNSPDLVSASTGLTGEPALPDLWNNLFGQEIVRLALGRVMAGRSAPFQPVLTSRLPGADRFTTAAQIVTAMRLFLDAEAQTRLAGGWRAKLAGDWVSPFFAGLLPQTRPVLPGQAEAAALLTADFIYQHYGPEVLSSLLTRLPQAISWNQIFSHLPLHATLPMAASQTFLPSTARPGATEQRYSTLLLEIEVAHNIGIGKTALADLYRQYGRPIERPPLVTKLRYLDNRSQGQFAHFPTTRVFLSPFGIQFNWPYRDDRLQGWRLYVGPPGQPEPLLVEAAPELVLTSLDGLPLSPGCLGPGAELTIEGEWLEAPYRFQASHITVQRALRLNPRPAGPLAHLLVIQNSSKTQPPSQLMALTDNGSLRPLFNLNPGLQLFPVAAAEGEPVRLLIQSDVPNCRRSWFGLYEPAGGLSDSWFAPAGPVQWIWRPDQARPVFIKLSDDYRSYQVYEANRSYPLERTAFSRATFAFLGWRLASRQLVTLGARPYGTLLGLLDPATNQVEWRASPPATAIRAKSLSSDGDWLVSPTGLPSLSGPSSRIYLLHLDRPGSPTPFRLGPGQGLASLAWSLDLKRPALALLAGPIVAADAVRATRLLWMDPDQPEAYVEVAQAGEGEQFASAVFCHNGDLLYVAEQAGRYELRRQQPGQPARSLFSLERPFYPIVCNSE
jgi:hypothetical protein